MVAQLSWGRSPACYELSCVATPRATLQIHDIKLTSTQLNCCFVSGSKNLPIWHIAQLDGSYRPLEVPFQIGKSRI